MLFKNQNYLTYKSVLMVLLLMVTACKQQQPEQAEQEKLVSGLKTQYDLINEGNTGSARVRLRQYMVKHGETSQPLFLMGLSYHNDKQYSKAIEWFTKSIESNGDTYSLVWHFMGWSHYYLGESEASKKSFDTFLQTENGEPDTMFALGLIAMEGGDFKEAKSIFLLVISSPIANTSIQAKAKARLADVYVELGDRQHAIVLYQEAVKQNPNLYEAWHRLATTLQRVGKNAQASIALHECTLARNRVRPDLHRTTRFPE